MTMEIEYKVLNKSTIEQNKKIAERGRRITTLKDVLKSNKRKRKIISKLESIKNEISKL